MALAQVAHIGEYLHTYRQSRELSQNQVADLGGPYRQAQAAIESGDPTTDLSPYARAYDRAYRWPLGMTQTLDRHIRAGFVEALPDVSYSARYAQRVRSVDAEPPRIATLGFNADPGPNFGSAVDLEPDQALLTNGHPLALTALAASRAGITFVDTTLDTIRTPDDDTSFLGRIHDNLTAPYDGPTRETTCYQIGAGLDVNRFGRAITIDPISSLISTVSARALATGLAAAAQLDVSPGKIDSLAYTLLGIAAYGGGMRTVTDLDSLEQLNLVGFLDYWRSQFYNPEQAGPALASPDRQVGALLAGLLAARDRDTTCHIVDAKRPATQVEYSGPSVVDVDRWDLRGHIVITYDAQLAPEVPIAVQKGIPTCALHYYAADPRGLAGSHAVAQCLGGGIGVTDAPDDVVLAARDHNTATLTHWIGSTAIYTPVHGFPRRIYLPDR